MINQFFIFFRYELYIFNKILIYYNEPINFKQYFSKKDFTKFSEVVCYKPFFNI